MVNETLSYASLFVDKRDKDSVQKLVRKCFPRARYHFDKTSNKHYIYGVYLVKHPGEHIYVLGREDRDNELNAWLLAAEQITVENLWDAGMDLLVK